MKKLSCYSILILLSVFIVPSSAREFTGKEANEKINGAEKIVLGSRSSVPEFIQFRKGMGIEFYLFSSWAHKTFSLPAEYDFKLLNSEKDRLGMVHYRYQQVFSGFPIEGTMFIVHTKNNIIESVNGVLLDRLNRIPAASLSEASALSKALGHMNAEQCRWQIPRMEKQLKEVTGNPDATWFPKGELMLAPDQGKMISENYRLAYRFDVYSEKPLKREYVFVDAVTGKVLYSVNRIHTVDATGTALTRYSGIRTIITDSVNATTFQLRETGRGLGIETYNILSLTDQSFAIDFTDNDNFWNNVNAQQDEVAPDAHWGAEVTYDFYQAKFGRNSIDNAGQKLLSYVHYNTNYINANWDGTEMNYGDGDVNFGYGPLTCLDVTGHEISHGVTENTSNLGTLSEPESGALNEGFSDCMGNSIRQFGKNNAVINWLIGDEMGGTPFRSMSNPNQFGNPDTYRGTNWDFVNQEVHGNSTVLSHWFYLLTMGGSGINDNGDTYSVTGIGLVAAGEICYRMNTVYLFPDANYNDAKMYAINSAMDLFGECSNEVAQTVNAWHAVGIGNGYIPGVHSDFNSPDTIFCKPPASMLFENLSANGRTYTWDFGDGSFTSNDINPAHTYLTYGRFAVQLITDGGTCGIDTIKKLQYIGVDSLNPCDFYLPSSGTGTTLTDCNGYLYDNGGTTGNYIDNTDVLTTIAPPGASTVTLTFSTFALEHGYDYLYIYDGPNTSRPLIGSYTGFTLPNGGTITSTGGSVTIRSKSDQALNYAGFGLLWQCTMPTTIPNADFHVDYTTTCNGLVQFTDRTLNGPTSWHWNFGDGDTSDLQDPTHTYYSNGTYPVVLTATNSFGTDSSIVYNIVVDRPVITVVSPVSICEGNSASLLANSLPVVTWYDDINSGNAIHTGNTFNSPPLTSNTTYYAETSVYPVTQNVGPVDHSFGSGSNYNLNIYRGEIFNALRAVTLVSIKVYAQSAGNRTITLIKDGITLQSVTLNIPDGMSRVYLNWDIPVGYNYELGSPGNANLYRNNSSSNFPYTLNGVVTIIGNIGAIAGYYYYFYDWELQGMPCKSIRIPVDVNVLQIPIADFTSSAAAGTFSFSDLSTAATSWLWNFDDPSTGTNDTSTAQFPQHLFSAAGTHNVCLHVSNGSVCFDSTCQSIVVSSVTTGGSFNSSIVSIFPNPVKDELDVQFRSGFAGQKCELRLLDVLGKTVFVKIISSVQQNEKYRLDVSSLAPDAYMLEVISENQKVMKRIIRQ